MIITVSIILFVAVIALIVFLIPTGGINEIDPNNTGAFSGFVLLGIALPVVFWALFTANQESVFLMFLLWVLRFLWLLVTFAWFLVSTGSSTTAREKQKKY